MQNKYCRLLHAAGRNKIHTLYICVCSPCMQLDIQENQPPNKVEFLCLVSMLAHNLITNYITRHICIYVGNISGGNHNFVKIRANYGKKVV